MLAAQVKRNSAYPLHLLINTSIGTFFSIFRSILAEQTKRKASDGQMEARWRSGQIFSGPRNS